MRELKELLNIKKRLFPFTRMFVNRLSESSSIRPCLITLLSELLTVLVEQKYGFQKERWVDKIDKLFSYLFSHLME